MVSLLVAFVATFGIRILSAMRTSADPTITNKLILQMEARKTADEVIEGIREATEVVKPGVGETSPYLVYLDARNRIGCLYLETDRKHSDAFSKSLFRLIRYVAKDPLTYDASQEKVVGEMIKAVTFTSTSPRSVQVNLTLANEKGEFQVLSHVGLMNMED